MCSGILAVGLSLCILDDIKNTIEPKKEVKPIIQTTNLIQYQLNKQIVNYIKFKNNKIYDDLANILAKIIIQKSKKYNIDPLITTAIISCESSFNIFASTSVAYGLMQIHYKIWKKELNKVGIKGNIYNPKVNIEAGLYILTKYLNKTHNIELALYKYYGKRSKQYYKKFLQALGEISLIKLKGGNDG